MFTKKSCKLVESTDAVEIFFKAFKSSKMLQMVASEDEFVTQWSMVQSQMGKVVQFSLTWEAVDLLLNKFPKASPAGKGAQYRDCRRRHLFVSTILSILYSFVFLSKSVRTVR